MRKYLLPLLPFIVVIIIASFFRFFLLDRIPSGVSNDELDYLLAAKSVFLTGKEINGAWSPFSLTMDPFYLNAPVARPVYMLIAPVIGILNFSLFNARLPYVIINLGLVAVIYLFARKLFNDKVAFFAGLAAAISPWMIFIARTSFEAPVALFFTFLTLYLLLISKKWKILLTIPFFALALYSYFGFTLILFPILTLTTIYVWDKNNKKDGNYYLALLIVSLLISVFFVFSIRQQRISYRFSEISLPSNPAIASLVDDERRSSIKTPFSYLLSNKYTVFATDSLARYAKVFSTDFLFTYGENTHFSLKRHGAFYYVDSIFMLIGGYYLIRYKRKVFALFFGIITLSPLPSVIISTGETYMFRSAMFLPIFILLIGIGIWHLLNSIDKKFRKILFAVILVAYLLSLVNFLNVYFLRNPIYNSEEYPFSNRIIARYLYFAQKHNEKVLALTDEPVHNLFRQVTFYNNGLNSQNAASFSKNFREGNLKTENAIFTTCPKDIIPITLTVINDSSPCKSIVNFTNKLSIAQLGDAGTLYNIYNDRVCSKYSLSRYPQNITLDKLAVDDLSEKDFCQVYINNK